MEIKKEKNKKMVEIFGFHGPQFSDIEIVGRCHKCGHTEEMRARDYEKKICRRCLEKDAVLIKLAWLDSKGMMYAMYLDNCIIDVPMLWAEYKEASKDPDFDDAGYDWEEDEH